MSNTNTSTRMKVGYYASTDVQNKVLDGTLDEYDIVFTSDSNEIYYITPSLAVQPIQARVYRFADEATAVSILNAQGDTHEGQIVAVKTSTGKYHGYIVNKDSVTNTYVITDMANGDYDDMTDTPITNKVGTVATPIELDALTDGTYRISGAYCFTAGSTVIYPSGYEFFMILGNDIMHMNPSSLSRLSYDATTSTIVEDSYVTVNDLDNYGIATTSVIQALFS